MTPDDVDRSGRVPKYLQVAELIRREIAAGRITDKVPSADTLAPQLNVARRTVLSAFKILRKEGDIVYTTGYGHFVATRG